MDWTIEELNMQTLEGAIAAIRSVPEFFYERDFLQAEISYRAFASRHMPGSLFLTARRGQEVFAVIGAVPRLDADRVYFLASFAVKKSSRGGGIGRTLLTAMEERLRQNGARILFTETTTSAYCDGTRAFYEAMGYRLVAEVPDFWADGDPLALYEKRLDIQ